MNPVITSTLVSALLFLSMLLSLDVGYRVGRRRRASMGDGSAQGVGTVDAAVFGLLGLILAFTFSGASDRLVVRRAQIVQEANAIGTAYLRVDMLAPSEQSQIRALFRQYLEARIEVFDKILDRGASNAALEKSAQLQREIWSRSVNACHADPKPDACLLVLPALNEMIDITTTRTMAVYTHAPIVVIVLLVMLSLIGAMLSGFAMSQAKRSILHMLLFALAISSAVYVVLDLEYPWTCWSSDAKPMN